MKMSKHRYLAVQEIDYYKRHMENPYGRLNMNKVQSKTTTTTKTNMLV